MGQCVQLLEQATHVLFNFLYGRVDFVVFLSNLKIRSRVNSPICKTAYIALSLLELLFVDVGEGLANHVVRGFVSIRLQRLIDAHFSLDIVECLNVML